MVKIMEENSEEFLDGLVAGFFYADGCVVSGANKDYNPHIFIYNTNRKTLECILEILGEGHIRSKEPDHSEWSKKTQYIFEVSDKRGLEKTISLLLRYPLDEEKAEKLREAREEIKEIEPAKNRNALKDVTKEELEKLYVQQGKSLAEVAERYGVHKGSISDKMQKLGIPRRPQGSTSKLSRESKEKLEELYWEKEMSLADIGEKYGVAGNTVLHRMKEEGIPRRDRVKALRLKMRQGDKDG